MRSPAWMLAYAVMLVLLAGTYAALIFVGREAAFLFAVASLVAVVIAVILVVRR